MQTGILRPADTHMWAAISIIVSTYRRYSRLACLMDQVCNAICYFGAELLPDQVDGGFNTLTRQSVSSRTTQVAFDGVLAKRCCSNFRPHRINAIEQDRYWNLKAAANPYQRFY